MQSQQNQEMVQTPVTDALDNADQQDKTIEEKQAESRSFKEQQEENFRRLREKAEQQSRTYEEKINSLQQQLDQAKRSKNIDLGDDDIAVGKHIAALQDRIEALNKNMEAAITKQNETHDEWRIQKDMPDASQIVTEKNISILREKYPHLYDNIRNSMGGTYDKAKVAYTLIKEMGIAQQHKSENMIDHNLSKPGVAQGNALSQKHLYDEDFGEDARKAHMKLVNSYIRKG